MSVGLSPLREGRVDHRQQRLAGTILQDAPVILVERLKAAPTHQLPQPRRNKLLLLLRGYISSLDNGHPNESTTVADKL